MDTMTVVFRALELLPRFIQGRPEPAPKPDYDALRAAFPKFPESGVMATEFKVTAPMAPVAAPVAEPVVSEINVASAPVVSRLPEGVREVATACMSCSRSHLAAISGALGEALRFARDEGIASPEVQRRIGIAEEEVVMLERVDLSPSAVGASPEADQVLARKFLPSIRVLRQDIGSIASVDELEKTAANAHVLGQEVRLGILQARGVDLNPIVALAKRVQAGELSIEAAKSELKRLLPPEEEE